jgi:hypothetical protein
MNYLFLGIKLLRPTAEFSFKEQDYSTVIWTKLDGDAPTQTEIDNAIQQIKADEIIANNQTATDKAALLAKLGITADEAKLLLS